MSTPACLLVCDTFRLEAEAVIRSAGLDHVQVMGFRAECGQGCFPAARLDAQVAHAREFSQQVHVLGGLCLRRCAPPPDGPSNCAIHTVEQCAQLLAGESLHQSLLQQGAFLLTPGWLARWRQSIQAWGFDQSTAREFFAECTRKLVLLDTGVIPSSGQELQAMAAYLDLPAERLDVTLETFQHYLLGLLDQELPAPQKLSEHANRKTQEAADYAMVLELLQDLTGSLNEEAVAERLLDMAECLFGAQQVSYLAVVDGKPGQAHTRRDAAPLRLPGSLQGPHLEILPSGAGLLLRLHHRGELLGCLMADHVSNPEFLSHYLNVSHAVASVGGLAVANARAYQALLDNYARLEETNRRLQLEIEERLRTEAALVKARQDAEQASQAKSQFLANVSHELRTPLNGIQGSLELLMLDVEDHDIPKRRMYLDLARKSSDHLLSVIDSVLDLSKIEAGKLELEALRFDLRHRLQDGLDPLRLLAERKGLKLHLEIAPPLLGEYISDPGRLRQVLCNLVGNAIKFTERGQITVRVSPPAGAPQVEGLRWMLFTVTDTGPGIPIDKQHLLFSAFSQVDSSNTRRFGGVGLGLAISKRIVEAFGGRIWVSSQAGLGTTFSFELAMRQASPASPLEALPDRFQPAGPQLEPNRLPRETSHRPRPEPRRLPAPPRARLLLAEDNQFNAVLLEAILERRGYQVKRAGDGESAIAVCSQHEVDVVLMDVQMPGVGGLEATQRIREAEALTGRRVPIIGLTAFATPGDRDRCLEAGMDDFLTKPVDMPALMACLERHVGAPAQPG